MRKWFLFFLPIVFLPLSCGTGFLERDGSAFSSSENSGRKWTVMVYMAADNNLESAAIADFNEMELARFGSELTVLVLFDRAEGFDATNGDWTSTRLYKISPDNQVNKTLIASERLDCPELGLSVREESELDMANPATLSGFLSYGRRSFPAEHFALVLWGHGTGWRSIGDTASPSGEACAGETYRAVALDSASSSYMTISALRGAIEDGMDGTELSVVAFDTCFGLCLESAYELCDCASYMLGTPALVPESGWDYTEVFNRLSASDFSVKSFVTAVSEHFSELYKNYPYAAFSCVDLSKIPSVVEDFSLCAKSVADSVKDKAGCEEVFTLLTDGSCVSYSDANCPTDFYLDVKDFSRVLGERADFSPLNASIDEALVSSWSAGGRNASFGVFFCVYASFGVIQTSHPSAYVRDSLDTDISRFVRECRGYVPSRAREGSLLDILFYTFY